MKTLSIRKIAIVAAIAAGTVTGAHAAPADTMAAGSQSVAMGAAARILDRVGGKTLLFSFASNQVYGERCVTKVGWCKILPQPVGAPCKCGNVDGTTLQ